MANEEKYGDAFGKVAPLVKRLADLTRQIKKQGGLDDDVSLLENDRILERVAKVLARAGRLKRPFNVWMRNGPDSHIQIFFIGLTTKKIGDLDGPNCLPTGCRFATDQEMRYLLEDHPDFLDDDETLIIGAKDERFPNRRWAILKAPKVISAQLFDENDIPSNTLFAVTFTD